jgi:type IV pilus assembly protein PilF
MSRFVGVLAICLICQGCVSTTSSSSGIPESTDDAAMANLNLGIGYLRQGRPEIAIDVLSRALEFNPRLTDAHSTIAVAYDQLGRTDEAEEHYQQAARLAPNNPGAANSYAVFLCRSNRWENAEPYFLRAAENQAYSTPEAALANAGVCARNAGELEKAESYFRSSLARNSTYPDALFHLTDLSYQSQNYLQARAFMQRALDASFESAELFWLCVQIEQELNSLEHAQQCATQLKEGFPESAQAAQLFQIERNVGR